jgi:hypothetical protein
MSSININIKVFCQKPIIVILVSFITFHTLHKVINQNPQMAILTYQILENYQKKIFDMKYSNLHDKLILRTFDIKNLWIIHI